jgi:CelD/BcsL family acetyltransferase involved in cellulose biosynthesis
VARIRLSHSPDQFRLLVATVWRGDDLIGVWPLSLQRRAGAWLARSLDDPFGQFAGAAFRDGADIAPGVATIVAGLPRHADGMQIEAAIAGSRLHEALLRHKAKAVPMQDAVVVDLRPFSSFDAFMQTIDGKTRRNLRHRRSRLDRAHQVDQVVATDGEDLKSIIRQTFDGRLEWLRRNGRTSPAFRSQELKAVVDGLIQAEGIELLATSLRTERGSVATDWGFVYAGAYYYYMTAMDPDYHEFSPGRLKLAHMLEVCFRRGIKVAELLAPAMDYKLEWRGSIKKLDTISLPFTIRGRLILGAADWAMPKVRRMSRLLPESLRRSLVRRLNRS